MDKDNGILREREQAALAEAFALAKDAAVGVVRFCVLLIPAALRVLSVIVAALCAINAVSDSWQAFGGDGAALIPAFALGVIPLLFAFVTGVHFGGMAAAALGSYVVSQLLLLLPALHVQALIVIVLAALTFSDMAKRNQTGEPQDESQI